MYKLSRRNFMGAVGATSVAALLPTFGNGADQASPIGSKIIDISPFNRVLLPREHGQLSDLNQWIRRRYPSRDHCMQMAAFFNDRKGLLVVANDPQGGVADWQIIPRVTLKIDFYENIPDVMIMEIEPTLEAAAAAYKKWATQQYWITQRNRSAPQLDFVSVASSSSAKVEKEHLIDIFQEIKGTVGVWFTQWRSYPFDQKYPDYTPKEPSSFPKLLSYVNQQGGIAFPYINGLLWDNQLTSFKTPGEKLSVRSRLQDTVAYNEQLKSLRYACPLDAIWQNQLIAARNQLKDSEGKITKGVYLDMLAAAEPLICWATNHGHTAGDAGAWRTGIRQLLKKIDGLIMVEGCAEVYLDLFDYPLMHLHTDKSDTVPLWNLVYGDRIQTLGWNLPIGVDSQKFDQILRRAQVAGTKSFGSPWMTSESEAALIKRNILKSRPSPPIPRITPGK